MDHFDDSNLFPKILIIGETFRTNGGGGITLLNLFKDWPADNLAVITDRIFETTYNANCKRYYQLGHLEQKLSFPFNLFNKLEKSGEAEIKPHTNSSFTNKKSFNRSLKPFLRKIYNNTLFFFGIYHFVHKLTISTQLLKWIEKYSPDIIYSQPFRYVDMVFAKILKEKTGIPLVIHIMDDSISFINKQSLLYYYWQRKIESAFKQLIECASAQMSISQAMSDEYLKRYKKVFIPFRNPIETETWSPFSKTNWEIKENVKILYTGRLAVPNINSLYRFTKVVDILNNKGYKIEFDIYSIDYNINFKAKVDKLRGTTIYKALPYKEMPNLMSKYDIVLLPIDFSKKGLKYAKFSISTKTSEYMISGVPIVLFAPKQVALTTYSEKNKCMVNVTENDIDKLSTQLIKLIKNKELRKSIGQKAMEVAKDDSSGVKIREDFRKVLIKAKSKLCTQEY
jgi:glycosyltransferase involved in cell wall biosynthesis